MLSDVQHYIVLISRNISIENHNESFLLSLSIFQAFLIIADSFAIVFIIYCLITLQVYHYNLQTIFMSLAFEYVVELVILTTQNAHIWIHALSPYAFTTTSFLQGICYSYVSFVLPAVMLERGCATYFLRDYERKKRPWISFIIVICSVIISIIFSFWLHYAETTYVPIAILLVVNVLSSLSNFYLKYYNNKKLRESTNLSHSKREYSLAERFQIAENIKTCEMVEIMVYLVTAFNFLIAALLILDNIDLSPNIHNITRTVFNVCVLIYGSIIIMVIFLYTEPWRLEASKVRDKLLPIFLQRQKQHSIQPDFEKDTNQYFSQLTSSWEIQCKA